MSLSVIQVRNLTKYFKVAQKSAGLLGSFKSLFSRKYKEIKAVNDVSFEINEGEMVAFLGPNGAGKTTTLKMLSGILYPTKGYVNVLGYIPQDRKPAFQKQISLVMGQKNQLWWDLPATDTFLLNKDIYNIPDSIYQKTLNELTDLLDVRDILNTPVRRLSLGQRMKCELIASLLHQPKILFLDEPTIGLDITMQRKIRGFLKKVNKEFKTTVILTSHYMDDVKEVCDRVIMINQGHKIYDGQIKELINDFANEKYLNIDFEEPVKKDDLEKIGKVIQFEDTHALLSVPRHSHAQKAAEIINNYPVDNLDIKEVELEDIIIKYFDKRDL